MPRLFGLRTRLILLVLFALAPASAILISNTFEHRERAAAEARAEVLTLSQLAADQQEQVLESVRQVLLSLAEIPEVRGDDPDACTTKLAELLAQYEGYTGFAVVRLNGDLFCRTTPLTERINVADSFSFQHALETGSLAVGEYQVGRASGKPNLGVCHPIFDEAAQPAGAICGAIDLYRLVDAAAGFQLEPGSTLIVLDRNGTILVRYPDPQAWIGKNLPDEPLIQAMLTRQTEFETTGLDHVERLYAITPIHGYGELETGVVLSVGVPLGFAYAELNRQLYRDLGLLAAAAVLTLALAWWGSTAFVLRQVKNLMSAAERLSRGDLSARTSQGKGRDEISQLGRTFDSMAAALEQRERERRQAEQALHEQREWLQVTLTSIGDAVIATDAQGWVTFMNPVAQSLTGWTEDEARGRPLEDVFQIVNAQTRNTVESPVTKVISRGAIVGLANHTLLITRGGKEIPIDDSGAPIRDGQGKIVGVVLIFRDITERAQAETALRLSHEQLAHAEFSQRLLAEAGRLLSTSLDWQTRLTQVAQMVVPEFADWSAIDVLESDGTMRRVVVAHVDPQKVELAYELQRRYPPDPKAPRGVWHVLRTGASEFYPVISKELIKASVRDRDAEYLRLIQELQLNSAMVVPLTAHGRTLGALTLVWAESGRFYSTADFILAEEIGRRAGMALEGARLYAKAQSLNADLERRIAERMAQLRELSAHLQTAREEERTQIARELHDELGQMLAGLKIEVAGVQHSLPDQDSAMP